MPTLLAGDFILVNKFTYGLRVPILNDTFLRLITPNMGMFSFFIILPILPLITLNAWLACLEIK